jgi:AraC-like DNA-binding protein
LYVPDVERVRAWRTAVPGVSEVLHAHFTDHVYPAHVHEQWTLLLVDTGGVDYTLERDRQQAVAGRVTVLPPQVSHDGRSASAGGFDKRVVYLDDRWLPERLTGAAVRRPSLADIPLARAVSALHRALAAPGEELEAESRLALVVDRVVRHLDLTAPAPRETRDAGLARWLRDRLDADPAASLEALAAELGLHASHLVRVFGREYGLPPHRFVTGQRLDRARGLLLAGEPIAEVAVTVGFHDQSHLTRHFRRLLGVPPGRYRGAA